MKLFFDLLVIYSFLIQTGAFQATNPFSTNIQRIGTFVKKYFPSDIHESEFSGIENYLDDDMKEKLKKGSDINGS